MRFKNPPKLGSRSALVIYLETALWTWLKDVASGLTKLNFLENFESFQVENLSILNGQEVEIPNDLRNQVNGAIPTSRIITRQQGNGVITDGSTPWTSDLVYLKNEGPSDVVISVIFFK